MADLTNKIDEFTFEPPTLINLCRKHNAQILSLLQLQKHREDVKELVHTTSQIQQVLSRCITDYGDLKKIDPKAVENVYVSICKYERKIQRLQRQGAIAKILSQARLRGKIDQLSTRICLQVETLEKEIKRSVYSRVVEAQEEEVFKNYLMPIISDQRPNENNTKRSNDCVKDGYEVERKLLDKDTKLKIENKLSLVGDQAKREKILSSIVNVPVKPLKPSEEILNILSVNDESEKLEKEWTYARSVSTYPMLNGKRSGDPICDHYYITSTENRTIAALADGCGWGERPALAARRATRMFMAYMKAHAEMIATTGEAAALIARAYASCHQAIVYGLLQELLFDAGTTTMIAGITLELATPDKATGRRFAFVFGSIGDCKGYLYSAKDDKFEEMTKGNRGSRDLRDPGGRLGPWIDPGLPDLRNFRINCHFCDQDDLIAVVSDGIHDNLDPKGAGKKPSEIGLECPDDDWEKLDPADTKAEEKIYEWSMKFINGMMQRPISPISMGRTLIKYAQENTENHRNFLETNPEAKKVPDDYTTYKGKLDHTTCLIFKVGITKHWTRVQPSTADNSTNTMGKSSSGNSTSTTINTSASNSNGNGPAPSFIHRVGGTNDVKAPNVMGSPSSVNRPVSPQIVDPLVPKASMVSNTNGSFIVTGNVSTFSSDDGKGKTLRTSKFAEYLSKDLQENGSDFVSQPPAQVVMPAADLEAETEQERAVWDELFGSETYVVLWDHFIQALRIPVSEDDESKLKMVIDYSKTGSVTRFKFIEFLKGFGPLSDCIDNVRRTVSAEFFHGFVTSNEAQYFLRDSPKGTFLIRFSGSRSGAFVLDYVIRPGVTRSVRINKTRKGFEVPVEGQKNELTFKSLQELVDIYTSKQFLRNPFISSLMQQPWFFGDISREAAEQLLKGQPPGTFLVRFSSSGTGRDGDNRTCFAASFVGQDNNILRGLIKPAANGNGYQVQGKGMVFANLVDMVKHYQETGYFIRPLKNIKLSELREEENSNNKTD